MFRGANLDGITMEQEEEEGMDVAEGEDGDIAIEGLSRL